MISMKNYEKAQNLSKNKWNDSPLRSEIVERGHPRFSAICEQVLARVPTESKKEDNNDGGNDD